MSRKWTVSVFALAVVAAVGWWGWRQDRPVAPLAVGSPDEVAPVARTQPHPGSVRKHDPRQAAAAWAAIAPKVQAAQADLKNEARKAVAPVRQFFAERKRHARRFAEDTLSWGGKLSYVHDFFEEGAHARRIHTSFERFVFSDKELAEVIESAVRSYLSAVQGRENQLLVDIRADLPGDLSAPGALAAPPDLEALRRQFGDLVRQVAPDVGRDLGVLAGKEAVSTYASGIAGAVLTDLAAAVAARAGVSGGILATGAASSVATIGVGLVAGLLIDQVLDWLIREAGYDPEGAVAAKLEDCLGELEVVLLDRTLTPIAQPTIVSGVPSAPAATPARPSSGGNKRQPPSDEVEGWSFDLPVGQDNWSFDLPPKQDVWSFDIPVVRRWSDKLPGTAGLVPRLEQAGVARGKLWGAALRELIFEGGDR